MSYEQHPDSLSRSVRHGLLFALPLWAAVFLLCSCATYEALTTAPPDFWRTLEAIITGIAKDLASIVSVFI